MYIFSKLNKVLLSSKKIIIIIIIIIIIVIIITITITITIIIFPKAPLFCAANTFRVTWSERKGE